LVEARTDVSPEVAEQWRTYLFFLRGHAAADGHLPPQFASLVEEVFTELIDRTCWRQAAARGGRTGDRPSWSEALRSPCSRSGPRRAPAAPGRPGIRGASFCSAYSGS